MRRWIATTLLMVSLTSCRSYGPKWQECHTPQPLEMSPRSSCVIYEAIMRQVENYWQGGFVPTAVRLNSWTLTRLRLEVPKLIITRDYGREKAHFLSTDYRAVALKVDETMPHDLMILMVDPNPQPMYMGDVEILVEREDDEAA